MTTSHRPPSLVGREDEVQALLQSYQRNILKRTSGDDSTNTSPQSELVLIRGASGSGKTALAKSLQPVVQHDDGYFLPGKFDLVSKHSTPYAVFVSAITHFSDQLLETTARDEARLSKMRHVIQEAVGSEGKLLVEVIPALERIIGMPNDEESERRGLDASRHFQFLFCRLCFAISSVAPMVLFLDDLQWSDSASLQLLQSMLLSRAALNETSSLLVIGTYRDETMVDNENPRIDIQTSLPFINYLSEFHGLCKSSQLQMTNIHLQNLDEAATYRLVADILNIPECSKTDLGAAVFCACKGNPLHAVQILNDILSRSPCQVHGPVDLLQWDVSQIVKATRWTESVDELFRSMLASLPKICKSVLQVAACLGDEIDESAIAMALDLDLNEVTSALQVASAYGHCEFIGERGRYRFAHDRIRQAALSTISSISCLSFRIGYKLWTKSSPLFLSTNKFIVAHLLRCGVGLIDDKSERYNAAAFQLEAGIEAASKAHFPDSSRFLRAGIEFLKGDGDDSWNERYDLTLNLYNASVDTEICLSNFENVDTLVKDILEHARSLQDKLVAHIAAINSFGQRGLIPEAVAVGIDVMNQLGEPLPESATKLGIIWEVVKTKYALRGRTNDELLRLHRMNDDSKLAAMHVLSVLLPYTYQAANFYTPILGTRLVRMCLKFGMHKNCTFAFITFAMILCMHDRKEGYRLGLLALAIVQRWRAKALLPRVHVGFYSLIHHWKCPLHASVIPLQNAVQLAKDIGDMEVAMIGSYYACSNLLHGGSNLVQVEKTLLEATQQMRTYKQEIMLQCALVILKCVQNLTGSASDLRTAFSGDNIPEAAAVRATYLVWGANLAFRFGDYELANKLAEGADSLNFKPFAQFGYSVRLQTDALIAAARARAGCMSYGKAHQICKSVWKKMKSWEADCPENFSFKRSMVEAELKSLKRHQSQSECSKILSLYNEAVQSASEQGFMHEAALASELAGDFMHSRGDDAMSKSYWEQAHRLYLTWGGARKAAQLADKTGISPVTHIEGK